MINYAETPKTQFEMGLEEMKERFGGHKLISDALNSVLDELKRVLDKKSIYENSWIPKSSRRG